jgi:hypothetical protein
MSSRNGSDESGASAPRSVLESPFLQDEMFVREQPDIALLEAESPYHAAFAHGATSLPAADQETFVDVAEEASADPDQETDDDGAATDDFVSYLEDLVDEEVFDDETRSAEQEWQAEPGLHRHFLGGSPQEKYARYLQLRPLYQQATGASDPAAWLARNIVSVSFFGKTTPAHRELREPLAAAEAALRQQGRTPSISRFWGFVPRSMRTRAKLSNHALGRAVDIDPATNPHIVSRDEILVIRQATGVDLGSKQDHAAMRRASQTFQRTFGAAWLEAQASEVRAAAARSRARLDAFARGGFLTLEQPLVDALIRVGFTWGGDWKSEKDFMHFDLPAGTRAATPAPGAGTAVVAAPSAPGVAAEQVRFVQRVLNAAQGENLKVDGDYGPLTRGALERFRGRYRLGTGGGLDPRTELALAQRALEEIRQQSLFAELGTLDAVTREVLAAFRSERGLGAGATLDEATRAALADAVERKDR